MAGLSQHEECPSSNTPHETVVCSPEMAKMKSSPLPICGPEIGNSSALQALASQLGRSGVFDYEFAIAVE